MMVRKSRRFFVVCLCMATTELGLDPLVRKFLSVDNHGSSRTSRRFHDYLRTYKVASVVSVDFDPEEGKKFYD